MAAIQQNLPDTLPYEYKRKGIGGFIHLMIIRVLNRLPKKVAQFLFTLASERGKETRTVSETAATFRALEVMYTFPQKRKEGTATLSGLIWWTVLDNARSVWNRLLLVEYELRNALLETAKRRGSARLLSIGSGSARPVIETMASLVGQIPLKAMLLDRDSGAIRFSKELATEFGLNHIEWKEKEFFEIRQHCQEFRPQVIELVGLLDYLTDKQASVFLKLVFHILEPGRVLITGNIAPNLERPYVEKGVNWPPMHYRIEEKLSGFLQDAGFTPDGITIQREPLGIHMVAVARKPQESMVS